MTLPFDFHHQNSQTTNFKSMKSDWADDDFWGEPPHGSAACFDDHTLSYPPIDHQVNLEHCQTGKCTAHTHTQPFTIPLGAYKSQKAIHPFYSHLTTSPS